MYISLFLASQLSQTYISLFLASHRTFPCSWHPILYPIHLSQTYISLLQTSHVYFPVPGIPAITKRIFPCSRHPFHQKLTLNCSWQNNVLRTQVTYEYGYIDPGPDALSYHQTKSRYFALEVCVKVISRIHSSPSVLWLYLKSMVSLR